MRVIVTRPESEAGRWVEDLRQRGFDAVALPLIAIQPAPPDAVRSAWARLDSCRAVMFVSGNAVRHFFGQRPAHAPWPPSTRAWATGAGTRLALVEAGLPADSIDAPPAQSLQFDSETLWAQVAVQVAAGDRVMIVRGGDARGESQGRDWLAERLKGAGAGVEAVVAYWRDVPHCSEASLSQARQDAGPGAVWLFSSSQGIAHLLALLPGQSWAQARAVATHPRIARAARLAGFGVVCESRPSLDAVATALESIR